MRLAFPLAAALVLVVIAPGRPARAEGDVTGLPGAFTAIRAGIICQDGPARREAAPGTRLGYIDLVEGDITVGLATDRIPAIPGLSFGVVAMVAEGAGASGVRIINTHPPMGAEGSTRDVWLTDFTGGEQTASFFSFDFPEEQVPGDWTLTAMDGDRVLYSARFTVVDPAEMPLFANPCREPPAVS